MSQDSAALLKVGSELHRRDLLLLLSIGEKTHKQKGVQAVIERNSHKTPKAGMPKPGGG